MANEIKMNGYTVEMSTAGTVAKAMETLPVYQTIRGSEQWSKDKREQLVRDIIAGNYIPPIVYAVEVDPETGEKRLVIIDGQQRGRAIRDAVKNGTASPVPTSQIIYNQAIIDGIARSAECGHEVEITVPEI